MTLAEWLDIPTEVLQAYGRAIRRKMEMDEPFPAGMLDDIGRFMRMGTHEYGRVFETGLFFPLQRYEEHKRMLDEVRINHLARREPYPGTIMEIGADKGGGLYNWCLMGPKRVIACEIRGCPYRKLFELQFPGIEFLWLGCPSDLQHCQIAVTDFLKGGAVDALFIDGDKLEMARDFDRYKKFLAEHALAFFHDILDPEPRRGYMEVLSRGYRHAEIVDYSDTARALRNEKAGRPPANAHEGWLRQWRGASCGVGVVFDAGKDPYP